MRKKCQSVWATASVTSLSSVCMQTLGLGARPLAGCVALVLSLPLSGPVSPLYTMRGTVELILEVSSHLGPKGRQAGACSGLQGGCHWVSCSHSTREAMSVSLHDRICSYPASFHGTPQSPQKEEAGEAQTSRTGQAGQEEGLIY